MKREPGKPGPQKAVALKYEAGKDTAPRIAAKGRGYVAERIIELAREHGVHIHEDPDLVGLLSALDLDTEIPDALYRAVAEVLAFVYRMNARTLAGSAARPPAPTRRRR